MRQLLFFVFLLWSILPAQAQVRVGNVSFSLNADGLLVTQYDVQGIAANDSVYLAANGLKSGRILPGTVTGDIGRRVSAGTGKTIYWDIVKDGYKLNEDLVVTVLVKLAPGRMPQSAPTAGGAGDTQLARPVAQMGQPSSPAKPAPATDNPKPGRTDAGKPVDTGKSEVALATPTQSTPAPQVKNLEVEPAPKKADEPAKVARTPARVPSASPTAQVIRKGGGPANALLSALAPGVGNIFVQPGHKVGIRPAITVAYLGLLVYGLSQRGQSQTAYTAYKALPQFTEQTTADAAYTKANSANHTAIICTAGAAGIWLIDVTATLLRGLKNQQNGGISSQPARTQFSVATLGPTPVITLRHQF